MNVDNEFYHYRIGWWEDVERPSVDEMSIIDALDSQDLSGRSILHVGVGNSYVAKHFSNSYVTGLTNSILEYQKAISLGLNKYFPILIDKHDFNLDRVIGMYDVIIDPNIRSYSPSLDDAMRYFRTVMYHLKPGGALLTHEDGLAYRNPITFQDFELAQVPVQVDLLDSGVVLFTKHIEE